MTTEFERYKETAETDRRRDSESIQRYKDEAAQLQKQLKDEAEKHEDRQKANTVLTSDNTQDEMVKRTIAGRLTSLRGLESRRRS